ncbi:glycosyltransferase [Piscicoccus intestinalis]|uniref:glycosyltransferase n=1 Tax=Piscicoccus intestinalis TaxID=746033 RepID=UPI00083810F3|nr:glycosyltransferase [Piscicoccus intestinalis]
MHVVVSTTPIPAHTFNASVFVAALVAGGDRVTWHAPREYHAAISALGAEPADVERAWDPQRDSGGIPVMGTLREVRRGYARHIVGRAAGRVDDVERLLRRTGADLVLADTLAYGAGLAAQAVGVPWASFGDGPLHDRDPDTPPFGSGLPYRTGPHQRLRNRVVHRASDALFTASARALRETARARGLPPDPRGVLAAGVSPQLHLHGGVPGLEYPRHHGLPAGLQFVGSLYRRPPGAQSPRWCAGLGADPRPVIALTQGSLRRDPAELIEPTLHALADEDCTIVVAAGSPAVAARLRPPAGRARVLADAYVPYDDLLRHATVFVTNGGWTGVTTALAYGVPVVQAGRTEEKADIGRRVEWSSSGCSLRGRRITARALRAAVRRVRTDPAIRRGVAAVRAEFDARDAGIAGRELLRQQAGADPAAPTRS